MGKKTYITPQSESTFTITLASLADASGRQSTMITNSTGYPAAIVSLRIKSGGSAPSVGYSYRVHLLRGTGTIRDDGAGASDAAITIENAPVLGNIIVTATAAKNFYGIFDTAPLGPLGSEWGIAVHNASGQALSSTEGDHYKGYRYYSPDTET